MNTESSSPKLDLPPPSYFWKVVKRHSLWVVLGLIPVVILIALGLGQVKFQYRSSSTTVFDPRDSAITSQAIRYPDFDQISSTFLALKNDVNLLDQIADRIPWISQKFASAERPFFQPIIKKILPEEFIPKSWFLPDEEFRKMVKRNFIIESMKLTTVPLSFELNLETSAATPSDAKMLNETIMAVFVENQIRNIRNKAASNLTVFEAYEKKEKNSLEGLSEVFELYENQTGPLELTKQQKKTLKDRERNLVNRILRTQEEQQQTTASEIQRKLELEAQLTLLLSQKGPTHPEVIQKSGELRQAKSTQVGDQVKSRLNTLLRQLIELQARMKRAGIPIDTTIQFQNLTLDGQLFLSRLSQVVKEHKLEVENLDNQLQNSSDRTRYRYSVPPTAENALANKKRLFLVFAIAAFLVGGTILGIILAREIYSPLLYDVWKFRNKFPDTTIATVIPKKFFRRVKSYSEGDVTKVKDHLVLEEPNSGKVIGLQGIRKALYQHNSDITGKTWYITTNGNSPLFPRLATLATNLVAHQTNKDSVMIDLNPSPMFSQSNTGNKHDLIDFLEGSCKWKDIRLTIDDDGNYDRVGVNEDRPLIPPISQSSLGSLINALKKQYSHIIIKGLPQPLFLENSQFASFADHWIEFVDLETAPKVSMVESLSPNHSVALIEA
ncbi:MAG: hypothetical protein HRU19_22775 [Pseudobacteriovorax sp.]|nr:hypothetical protein [Pseudobacteriovorax sp.]